MGKGDPQPEAVDYEALGKMQQDAAAQQLVNNRPDVVTDFSTQHWTQDPNGNWTQTTNLTGGVGDAVHNAVNGVANMGQLDLSKFMDVGSGDSARDQAIQGAYSQAMSRLNPQFQQGREGLETKLLNQGLTPGSEAYERELTRFGMQQNDATQGAMNSAIAQGTAAGHTAFQDNLSANQFGAGLTTQQHNAPLAQLQGLQGFMAPMGFQADNATASSANAAAGTNLQGQQQAFDQWQATRPAGFGDILGSVAGIAQGVGGMMMSDERAKTDITRLSVSALPGVPFATFLYRDGLGLPKGLQLGVIAQDLEKVAPVFIHRRPDGLMMVDYSFMEAA